MADTDITDETLMAYADGELDPADAARVRAAIEADPALGRRAGMFERTSDLLAETGARQLAAPVPPALTERVRATLAASRAPEVIAFPPPRARTFSRLALAASLAAAVGLGLGYVAGRQGADGPAGGLQVAGLDDPRLAGALGTLPSGERTALGGGDEIAAIASFLDREGDLCREFEFDRATGATIVSVACHSDGRWDVRFAVAAASADASGYAPASSLEALDAYLETAGAGAPLSPEDEAQTLADLPPRE